MEIGGISLKLVLLCFAIVFATLLTRRILIKRILVTLKKKAEKTDTTLDDEMVEAVRLPLSVGILVVGIWLALSVLPLPKEPLNLYNLIHASGRIIVLLLAAWFVMRIINASTKVLKAKAEDPEHWLDSGLVPLILLSLKTVVAILVFVLVAQNLGYSISGLVASLGIGGIAVALAAKDALANLISSIMLMIDRPFRIGDWIKSGEFEGVVEDIGFRTTRIRTFEKTVQVVPNDKIANVMTENMDRRKDEDVNMRRVKMTVGVEYKASADEMEKAVEAIKGILQNSPNVDQRYHLVYFNDFGEFSLNIFVYYFANTTVWAKYLETRQEINLAIMRMLKEMGLSIAFPTQTIHMEKSLTEG